MTKNTAVFVTDQRQRYIADYLPGKVSVLDWKLRFDEQEAKDVLASCHRMVLPIPVSKIEKYPKINEILNEELINKKKCACKVYGGAFSENWRNRLTEAAVPYVDLMQMEEVALKNAEITAEATVAEILKYSDYSIRRQKVIVTGYGRCGRELALLLQAMGAKVTVLARSAAQRKLALSDGHVATDFSYGPEEVYGTRTIINTVPATVLKEPMLKEMHKDTVIIDIASRPGGVDLSAADAYGIQVIPALGLPGIYTTKSSARILANAITMDEESKVCEKEEKPWIFQIII